MSSSYSTSGVSLDRAASAKSLIAKAAKSTHTPEVLRGIGLFGGFYALDQAPDGQVLVASTDGVGTKVLLAAQLGNLKGIGEDLVHHSINDILVCGARPLFFLDYLAFGKLEPDVAGELAESLARGCRTHGVALIGGETAEMPGLYAEGQFDLAGTIVGTVRRDRILDGSRVKKGDVLLGSESSGPHTNGYSLIRKILEEKFGAEELLNYRMSDGVLFRDAVLEPHRCYWKLVSPLLENPALHAMSHITGGGLVENTERVIPEGLSLDVDWNAWKLPELFQLLQDRGQVSDDEMRRVFNCGIGLVLVVAEDFVTEFQAYFATQNEQVHEIGRVV
ncbi:MAG: phosphoribosylformylglycinamidine cyclo-ligase [Calditrichaeota bacterium]|nr:phosphoribosylformylglycinamidine cyclo-ligase [Calditrichota bacterium]MCB9366537.1 phosphoribosylformylglycinamidine cyclo-ligase [Calditrichota bacterium]MCB9391205.1 phosphoribosylformylglycinamidine cyclo-ligase [Calditrichota bacterium]